MPLRRLYETLDEIWRDIKPTLRDCSDEEIDIIIYGLNRAFDRGENHGRELERNPK